ncbi:MAG: homoserine kinase [Helicobacteraceae bacterium]|jgi:homoserine kinase|nr:homoserine kinase [Helicobacteraceae bacterium]
MNFVVPATSANLGSGFDALGVALKFYNEIEINSATFASVSLHGEGAKFLKTCNQNIFINIFNKTYENLTGSTDTFRFKFINNIPLSRGLGSSSAVIISALSAAYLMAAKKIGVAFDKREILNAALAYESHPDNITPAAMGGFCAAVANEGKVIFSKNLLDRDLRAVIVIPNKPINTRHSRSALPKKVSIKDATFNISRSSLLTAALLTRDYDLLREASRDRLHEEIRMAQMPELFAVRENALASGALMSSLSGSGSSFFSLARDQGAASKIAVSLAAKFPGFRVEILEFDEEGLRFF